MKPGFLTSEFLLSAAAYLASLLPLVMGLLPPESKIYAILGSVLAAITYIVSRSHVKATDIKAQALAAGIIAQGRLGQAANPNPPQASQA